jgi:hypothetical protein
VLIALTEQLATSLWAMAMAMLGYVPGTPLLEAAAGALGRNLSLFTPRYAGHDLLAFGELEGSNRCSRAAGNQARSSSSCAV